MTSTLDIANRALSAIGARSGAAGTVAALQSFQEQSNEAFQVNLLFNSTRDDLLRGAHWNFACKTVQLTELKSAPGTPGNATTGQVAWTNAFPAPPWRFEYAYPADCLAVREVKRNWMYGGGGGYGYPIMGAAPAALERTMTRFLVASDVNSDGNQIKCILTDVYQALGIYTAQILDPDNWDANFQQVMVIALAGRLVMPLTGDKQMQQELFQMAQLVVQGARCADGNEGTTQTDRMPDWISVRGWGDAEMGSPYVAGWDAIGWLGI